MSANELLVPADAEVAAIAELDSALAVALWGAVGVATSIPTDDTLPPAFVRVVGGSGISRSLVVMTHYLVIEAFAVHEQDAHDIAAYCSAVIERAGRLGRLGQATCLRSTVGAPSNQPHPDVPTHKRYSVTTTVDLRKIVV